MKRFNFKATKGKLILLFTLMTGVVISMVLVYIQSRQTTVVTPSPAPVATPVATPLSEPTLHVSSLLSGLSYPWEIGFLPNKTLLFSERGGLLSKLENGQKHIIQKMPNIYVAGEGGLTGLAIDSDFSHTHYLYTCFNAQTSTGLDVRVVRWTLSSDAASLSQQKDIITNIPSNASGRHSGCRLAAAHDGSLWVGTGDSAQALLSQSAKSLGGKILHVTRDGMPEPGNLPAPFDPRIFSYGHRNTQGIILLDKPVNGLYGYSVEHGSDVDDEINPLRSGNFGWAPRVTYVEDGIPMTDLSRFPDAISAFWSSGSPTIAPSGATQLSGHQWSSWNGYLALAVLKGQQLRLFNFDAKHTLISQKILYQNIYGRLRTAVEGPDGALYLTTDNGKASDQILKVTPSL